MRWFHYFGTAALPNYQTCAHRYFRSTKVPNYRSTKRPYIATLGVPNMATVISVVGQKGGTSKTTTAMALASQLGESAKTLLVDIDPQGSASEWAGRVVEPPFDFMHDTDISHLARLRDFPHELVIVDTPGSLEGSDVLETVVTASDFVLLPTTVSPLSLTPLVRTIRSVVEPAGKEYRVVVSAVDTRSPGEYESFIEFLESNGLKYLKKPIRAYSVHRRVALEGRLITKKSRWDKSSRAAAGDVKRMTDEVLELVGE